MNAYKEPRRIRSGCQHQLGCGCDPPYWLRESNVVERAYEERMWGSSYGAQICEATTSVKALIAGSTVTDEKTPDELSTQGECCAGAIGWGGVCDASGA